MKPTFFLLTLALSLNASVPHLEWHLRGKDYQTLFDSLPATRQKHELYPVLKMGKRMLSWLEYINDHRPPGKKISFSSTENQPASSIEKPRFYNLKILSKDFEEFKQELPSSLSDVILHEGDFSENPPLSDTEFAEWGAQVDSLYGLSVRWILMEPYLEEYAKQRKNDLRGFYFLQKTENLEEKFLSWESLPTKEKNQLEAWLINLCFSNGVAESPCASDLQKLYATPEALNSFYSQYLPRAQKAWDSYFALGALRRDIVWEKPDLATIPFIDPKDEAIKNFLLNIEDEWKWESWGLKLDFTGKNPETTAHVVFEPGVTPYVNGLAGNKITMDKNQPLTEYDASWTLRHEFGHVLGFKDCYIEFYDDREKVMISYQLDITNLMCSRQGKFKQIHFDELKRNYF